MVGILFDTQFYHRVWQSPCPWVATCCSHWWDPPGRSRSGNTCPWPQERSPPGPCTGQEKNLQFFLTVNVYRKKYSLRSLIPIIHGWDHKLFTYIEYRAVSGVFWTIDPPPPSPPSECVLPPQQRRGATHSPGGEGVHGNAVEWYHSRIVPCMEMEPRTTIIQC